MNQNKTARQTYIDAHYDDYFAALRRHQRRVFAFNAVIGIINLAAICTALYLAVHYLGK